MILLCGIPSDEPLSMVKNATENLGVKSILFDQRESQSHDIQLSIEKEQVTGSLIIDEEKHLLEEFTGVYLRLLDYVDILEDENNASITDDMKIKIAYLHETLINWLEIANCRVMNRVSAMNSNVSKPYQSQIIRRSGFYIPETLVTNDPTVARKFIKSKKEVIYKSISSVRSIVKKVDAIKLIELDNIQYLPTQFQEYIPGKNIRVHVVSNLVYAINIESDATDYRYISEHESGVKMRPYNLPNEIKERCLALSRVFDLPLCGIDLKLTPEGDYYCFEVNPSPAFSFDKITGKEIAKQIVKYLGVE